jgi:E3 ubiquitin-protein ligase TRIP12
MAVDSEPSPSPATGADTPVTQDSEEPSSSNAAPKEVTPNRTEILRSKAAVVDRFMQLLIPILVDVYAASVASPVRVKTLTGLLKAMSFLEEEAIKTVLKVRPIFSEQNPAC